MPPSKAAPTPRGDGPAPDQAAILARLESHARAFFGSSSEDEEGGRGKQNAGPPPAGRAHAAPAGPAESSDGTSSGSDRSSSDEPTSSDGGAGAPQRGAAGGGGGGSSHPTSTRRRAVVVVVAAGPVKKGTASAAAATSPLDLKAERKALMSGRVDVTGGGPLPAWKKDQVPRETAKAKRKAAAAAAAAVGEAGGTTTDAIPTKAEFAAMRREVEEFGVANLDKRARAAAETKRLSSLGFPAPKRPRIPASIGYGMAAKQKELAAAALEAAIDAGLVSRSGLGKKKRRAAEAARRAAGDGGAGSIDGSGPLRNGVLFVKEAPAKKRKGPGGGRRFNIDKIKL